MKPWYKSKTIWFNTASGIVGAIASSINIYMPFLTPSHYMIFTTVITAVNVWLRTVTAEGVSTTKE